MSIRRCADAMSASRARGSHVLRLFLVCVLSLWLTLSAAHALDPNKRLTQYGHTAWQIQDGFLPNTPYWISQTKDEYLWVGGVSGALRFDGVRFSPWSAPLASTPVVQLVNARAGEFWAGTLSELAHVRDNVVISHYDLRATQEARGGRHPDIEFRIVRPSGEVRIATVMAALRKCELGQPRQRFGIIQDITDRKRAEGALQQTQFYLVEGQRLAHMGS